VKSVLYDAGALIAADRGNKRVLQKHDTWLRSGIAAFVPTTVVAQVWRSPRQVKLARVLDGCHSVDLDIEQARAVGRLLALSSTHDVVDGSVVVAAMRLRPVAVVTSDREDLIHLATAAGVALPIVDV